MPLKSLMTRLQNFGREWANEFRLIRDIWAGAYPQNVKYTLSYLEKLVMCSLVLVRSFSLSHLKGLALQKESRTQISELYVVTWLFLLISFLCLPTVAIIPFLVAYRLIEGFAYRLCIIFVDRYAENWDLRSLNRSLILLLLNYSEIIVGFAVLYLYTHSIGLEEAYVSDTLNALYFSAVTITTLGDVRFAAHSMVGKILVSVETIMGLVFLALVVSMFVGGMRRIRDRDDASA